MHSKSTAVAADIDSSTNNSSPGNLPVKVLHNSKVSCGNTVDEVVQLEGPDSSEASDSSELQEVSLNDAKSTSGHNSGKDGWQFGYVDKVKSNHSEEAKNSDPLNLLMVLKKVIFISSY